VTPDPGFGGPNTGAGFTLSAGSAAETRQSARGSNFAATTQPMQQLRLYWSPTLTNNLGTTGGTIFGCLEMSMDAGNTWRLVADNLAYLTGVNVFVVSLPVGQDMTKFMVRAVVLGVGSTTAPQNVIARRIRDRGG